MAQNPSVRNIAIIAHVDHGKTTLVDQMFRWSGAVKVQEDGMERVMDSMDLERERGITIAAKNCAVTWNGVKVNIIDTPGHADFGGEVERSLMMVDGVILLVDSAEGPLPQTRFVLSKALEQGLSVIVVVNKIDRKDAQPMEVLDKVYDLFIDLGANDAQIEFPVLFAVGREGVVKRSLEAEDEGMGLLFQFIVEKVAPPEYDEAEPFQMLVLNLGYSDYVGRLAVGRVMNGSVAKNDRLVYIGPDGLPVPIRVSKLQQYKGLSFDEVDVANAGDIVVLAGADAIRIGDTVCAKDSPKALPRISVDEPTISMLFTVNSSPYAGKEGKYVQSQRILERLEKECLHNVALGLERTPDSDAFVVKGRGDFQMAILIETMRREGFELTVGRPQVILRTEEDGIVKEPMEHLFIDADEAYIGALTEKLSRRKGRMIAMENRGGGRVRLEFEIPSRGLIGYRNEFLTDTRGTGIMSSLFLGYEEYKGDIEARVNGSLVSDRRGAAVAYGIFNLEDRGKFFITPGMEVYEGMVVGEHNRDNDLLINVCKAKKLSNMRAAGKDDNVVLTPVVPITLEAALNFIREDERVEITPLSIRIRKAVLPVARGGD
jgi:GTP-binding protein